jgi:hypothetical protein
MGAHLEKTVEINEWKLLITAIKDFETAFKFIHEMAKKPENERSNKDIEHEIKKTEDSWLIIQKEASQIYNIKKISKIIIPKREIANANENEIIIKIQLVFKQIQDFCNEIKKELPLEDKKKPNLGLTVKKILITTAILAGLICVGIKRKKNNSQKPTKQNS